MRRYLWFVEVVGTKIIAHWNEEIELTVHTPETSPHLSFWWNNGFDTIIPGWAGYAFGRKKNVWYEIDLIEKKVLRHSGNPIDDDSFILGHVVSEGEWGEWVKDVTILRKSVT
jgi:hypothetical protein